MEQGLDTKRLLKGREQVPECELGPIMFFISHEWTRQGALLGPVPRPGKLSFSVLS